MSTPIFILSCLYFYIPAGCANMGAVLSQFVPPFNTVKIPVDFYVKIHNQRIIGDHKTLGGYAFGVLFGTLIGLFKYLILDPKLSQYLLFHINLPQTLILYFLMSNGALLGDLLKSYLKRILHRPPHSAWIPFDEVDHSTVAMLIAAGIVPVTPTIYAVVVISYFFIHIISNIIGFALKIKKVPY